MQGLRRLTAVAVFALAVNSGHGQAVPSPTDLVPKTANADVNVLQYEVVSIRPHSGDDRMIRMMMKPDGFAVTNLPLKMLVANAYGVKQDLVSGGPGWVGDKGFDVEAKVAGPDVETFKKLSQDQRRTMMIPVLEERFHLKAHVETKVLPIYELEVAKGGPKMTVAPAEPAPDPDPKSNDPLRPRPGRMMMRPGQLDVDSVPAASIAAQLGGILHRTVVDKTGLTGNYTFVLKYTPEEAMGPSGNHNDSGAEEAPSIFTAVQEQLGLKLVSSKGPVDTLVIDQAEMPTEN